ncbi:MAG: Uma2 family endonuclease [Myxacorys chilensis ATA2-1-KO14]|jgi:Uma2 family endonuclease|nr:Uma2 family endonuclease [Myxacorys chilensis ATA2-1-KO14]
MNLELAIAAQLQVQEQRFLLSGITWEQYETLRDLFDDRPSLKMFYLEGKLELFMPSEDHEEIKTILARLLELYAIEKNVRLYGYGSATYRKPSEERGLEPDECYYIGSKKQFPDIAIEVVVTSGLLDKLSIYQGLGVGEVWVWQDGQLFIQRLRESGYEQISRSEFLPELDLDLLVRCVLIPDQHDAAIAFRDALRS